MSSGLRAAMSMRGGAPVASACCAPGFSGLDWHAVDQKACHALDHAHIPLPARVDHARLLENRQHVWGFDKRLFCGVEQAGEHALDVGSLPRRLHRLFCGDARNRENGALGGLHHGFVGRFHAGVKGGGEFDGVGLVDPCELLGKAAKQKRGDDP